MKDAPVSSEPCPSPVTAVQPVQLVQNTAASVPQESPTVGKLVVGDNRWNPSHSKNTPDDNSWVAPEITEYDNSRWLLFLFSIEAFTRDCDWSTSYPIDVAVRIYLENLDISSDMIPYIAEYEHGVSCVLAVNLSNALILGCLRPYVYNFEPSMPSKNQLEIYGLPLAKEKAVECFLMASRQVRSSCEIDDLETAFSNVAERNGISGAYQRQLLDHDLDTSDPQTEKAFMLGALMILLHIAGDGNEKLVESLLRRNLMDWREAFKDGKEQMARIRLSGTQFVQMKQLDIELQIVSLLRQLFTICGGREHTQQLALAHSDFSPRQNMILYSVAFGACIFSPEPIGTVELGLVHSRVMRSALLNRLLSFEDVKAVTSDIETLLPVKEPNHPNFPLALRQRLGWREAGLFECFLRQVFRYSPYVQVEKSDLLLLYTWSDNLSERPYKALETWTLEEGHLLHRELLQWLLGPTAAAAQTWLFLTSLISYGRMLLSDDKGKHSDIGYSTGHADQLGIYDSILQGSATVGTLETQEALEQMGHAFLYAHAHSGSATERCAIGLLSRVLPERQASPDDYLQQYWHFRISQPTLSHEQALQHLYAHYKSEAERVSKLLSTRPSKRAWSDTTSISDHEPFNDRSSSGSSTLAQTTSWQDKEPKTEHVQFEKVESSQRISRRRKLFCL